jgi:hypothetical protein
MMDVMRMPFAEAWITVSGSARKKGVARAISAAVSQALKPARRDDCLYTNNISRTVKIGADAIPNCHIGRTSLSHSIKIHYNGFYIYVIARSRVCQE